MLTLIGRSLLPSAPFLPMQDQDNLDTFYYMTYDTTWKLMKIVWGSAPTVLTDFGTLFDGCTFSRIAAIAQNQSTLVGMLDATYHYAFSYFVTATSSATGIWIVDVNLATGTYTKHNPFADAGMLGYMRDNQLYAMYTTDGTIFYMPTQYTTIGVNYISWAWKSYGVANGGQGGIYNTDLPCSRDVSLIDEVNTGMMFSGIISNWYKTSLGSFAASQYPHTGPVLPPENTDFEGLGFPDWSSHTAGSRVPRLRKMWDDDWVYGFGTATGYHVLYFRKNLVTGQYQVAEMVVPNPPPVITIGNKDLAFDLWQTGTDVTKRRIFFSYVNSEKVWTSLAWPPVVTDSIALDSVYDGGTSLTNVMSVHTTNEYIYAFHSGGLNYGNCLSKLMESDLVAAPASPSIGGIGARLLFKDKRVFFIGVPGYGKYLWWGQPLEPQCLDVGWDGFNTTIFDDEDNTSLNALDDSLYVGSQKGFIRLRGKSPDSWVLDQTLATTGPLSDKTSSITPFGLIYPRENGLWLFNGFTSVLFFEKGKNLLNNVNWDEYARAFSLWDGRYYRLYYPSGTAIENDRELVVDLIGGIENARGTEGDRAATFGFADLTTNTVYLGDASGNLMTLGGTTAARSFSLTTKEYPCAGLLSAGTFAALHYDIDLAGATLSVIPICDGVEKAAKTITNTTRTRGKISLPDGNYYRVGFRFEVTTAAAVKFYDPWYLE